MGKMRPLRYLVACAGVVALLGGCADQGDRTADAACAIAVAKALPLLPENIEVEAAQIMSGKSGQAVSCKVTGNRDHIMIDATTTCTVGADALMECTTIDAIQTMDGEPVYP